MKIYSLLIFYALADVIKFLAFLNSVSCPARFLENLLPERSEEWRNFPKLV